MAEKRKLSVRDRREPSAKRRASEVAPQGSSKKKASTPSVAPTPPPALPVTPAPVEKPLPTKIKDGEALPTLSAPQPAELSDTEYQSIAESAVLLASLERSKKKWLSDGILERYYTKPKKSKREQIEGKNPPKESMVKVGACNIAVGPHLFDAMLYTVKDPNAPPPIQYTPPQRPMVHYGHPNFQQYQSYPQPPSSQQSRQQSHYSPAHSASPQPGYHQGQHPPPQPARTPNPQPPPHHPPHPPYAPQSAQRPPPSRNVQPPQPPKPSPDPVIQMLATRAASDPELKALMRVVASSKASQEQLRAFQAHIDELNAIIRAREQQQQRQQQAQAARQTPQTPHPPQQRQSQPPLSSQKSQQQYQQPNQPQGQSLPQQGSIPQNRPQSQGQQHSTPRVEIQVPKPSPSFKLNSQHPSQTPPKQPQTPAPQKSAAGTPQVKQEPGLAPTVQTPSVGAPSSNVAVVPPAPSGSAPGPSQPSPSPVGRLTPSQSTPSQGPAPRPGGQYPPYQGQSPAIQSRPPPHGSVAPYYRPAPPPPPPARPAYKSVVFEFTSPLTPYGSSTSGHAGSGDRYLLPEYSILEWLPGGNTVLASFLLTRKVDPNTPFPIEVPSVVTTSRGKGKSAKSKKADKSKDKDKKAADKAEEPAKDQDNGQPQPKQESAPADADPKPSTSEPAKPSDDKGDQKGQPAETPSKAKPDSEKQEDASQTNLKEYYQPVTLRIYSANPKFLEPLGRVVKPPEEVRKYMNEIMDRAERAPDGFLAMRLPREAKEDGHEPEEFKKGGTPAPAVMSGARSRALRGKTVDEDSEIENVNTPIEEEEEEEEELKDFYGPPTGLPPLRV